MMKTIPLNDLLVPLNYSDLRAVRNWCLKNDVLIITHGKNEFVFETNFQEVYELPFINKLKSKFGDDWEVVYRLYREGNISALHNLNNIQTTKYIPYTANQATKSLFEKKFNQYVKSKAA